jgi:hypothetical protein
LRETSRTGHARLTVSRVCSICSLWPLRFRRISAPTSSVSIAIRCALSKRRDPSSRVSVPRSSRVRDEYAEGSSSVYGSSEGGNPGPERSSER